MSSPSATQGTITPRIIIHGGAGSITRSNLPPPLYAAHRSALLSILDSTTSLLQDGTTTALEAATHAVTLLELHPLYNAGRGAVFTTAGRIEHEASVMLSTAHPGCAAVSGSPSLFPAGLVKVAASSMRTSSVKHPVLLARTMLERGNEVGGGGAQGHVQICGDTAEGLARRWGLEVVRPSWCWTRKRWEQHRRGRGLGTSDGEWEGEKAKVDREAGWEEIAGDAEGEQGSDLAPETGLGGQEGIERMRKGSRDATEDCGYAEVEGWNGEDYLPQGTVGAVVLDRFGTICVATSTGGMTNKLPGRIGDTPTIGAGFWAESWSGEGRMFFDETGSRATSPLEKLVKGEWWDVLRDWLPEWALPRPSPTYLPLASLRDGKGRKGGPLRAVGMSGTGNGDSFLKVCCVRTVAAMVRFSSPSPSLQSALTKMAGPGGLLEESAEERWSKTGEGEGGIIGVELVDGVGKIVSDFNCGGMFRAWVDDDGHGQMMVFRDQYQTA
ncbi:Isoaspartyl peptidase [Sphaceloma murrayae]|uniref:Isoaspartyl peptidase n=1 Tax=Sphaceloma murrayae TaxID=2082308 RepID=A0A2K1R3G9_9PEZI|nr:Isoaspartyl peptidase [Sphaceloma murrayae]